jgi:hypothetical protein
MLSQRDLNDRQTSELQEVSQGCTIVLEQLNKIIDKHSEIHLSSAGIRNRSRRVWKRFKWEPDDVQQLRSRLTSNISLLNALYSCPMR